ncbi:murein L,D-transpeptidase family protein [Psychrobacter sp. M13]|uniref:L,D-transpeptidase family protein n=1 Tax=Psychrobacter sp. M13 TaxID=3067275 RepID=UPI00273B7299|nr:L,D-transpeptidase family protein [Psychrobacter sp. M13]WLP93634.1 L,D-transpeptidase family protein [Psychrobacter sp. M13]
MLFSRLKAYNIKTSLWATVTLMFLGLISASAITYAKSSTKNTAQRTILTDVTIDKVFVDKSERVLKLLSDDKVIKTYHIALGDSPAGHKRQQGDERTPTGSYKLDYKNEKSSYYRSIHVSYPNASDKAQARKRGVSPGGDIMIHGQKNGFGHLAALTQKRDWTDGCIAVTDDEMDEIMSVYKAGMLIEIVE